MTQRLLYIISHAPYSNSAGQEALEAIIIGASFEQDVSVLFLHDGVFQLKTSQYRNNHTDLKEYTKSYRALADYGVKKFYCLESSLTARGLAVDQLIVEAKIIDESAVAKLIGEQIRVFTF